MFSVTISTLSESEKKVLKFKRLFYAQGTEVYTSSTVASHGPRCACDADRSYFEQR
jgi:hypothetical protein